MYQASLIVKSIGKPTQYCRMVQLPQSWLHALLWLLWVALWDVAAHSSKGPVQTGCRDMPTLHGGDEFDKETYATSMSSNWWDFQGSNETHKANKFDIKRFEVHAEPMLWQYPNIAKPEIVTLQSAHDTNMKTMAVGEYVLMWSWNCNNFGHVLHDYLPGIAMLREQGIFSGNTRLILPNRGVKKGLLTFIDPEFAAQIIWVEDRSTFAFLSGSNISYYHPQSGPRVVNTTLLGCFLQRWIADKLPRTKQPPSIVYYSRIRCVSCI